MNSPLARHRRSTLVPAVLALAGLAAVTGCTASSSSAGSTAGSKAVTVESTDDGCTPRPASVAAGAVKFTVTNKDATRVTETEIMQNGRILGEKENLTPGLSGDFTLRLQPGKYLVNCPNAKSDQSTFTVTGTAGSTRPDATTTAGVKAYTSWVQNQSDTLLTQTRKFAAAVKAGDKAKAKALYAPTRSYYENIEPVAETFGNLDPDIDARINDVTEQSAWTGFHRIERALWADDSLAGMTPIATTLLRDVTKLHTLVKTVQLQPAQIANGSVELLGEVASSKITGEEDRYSHTDLWDFDANIAGAREAFSTLEPVVSAKQPQLASTINRQFASVLALLARYQTTTGYVNFSTVGQSERRQMTQVVNALAESLSEVAPLVA